MTEFRDVLSRQARVRQREEQNTAERRCSTPTVHPRPQTGHIISSPHCIATTRRRACSSLRHRRDLHLPEQNTAAADFVGGSGTPHSRQYLRTTPPEAITASIPTAWPHDQGCQTST
ncbi:hypothetical protein, partial [Streptomyces sp. NPDC056337]|uniref:hypothetical protein n=1 Tax=Streptomyces sp. NPDC056337 TaxID=3345787 RepID=UPI0035D74EEB